MRARDCRPSWLICRLLRNFITLVVIGGWYSEIVAQTPAASDTDCPVDRAENLRRANAATVSVCAQKRRGYRRVTSRGSGVVISAEGYVLTARHIVQDFDEIEVQTIYHDEPLTAEFVCSDSQFDIALLKVQSDQPMEVATLAAAQSLVEGRKAFVIGNPLGAGQSVRGGAIGDDCIVRWEGHRARMRVVHAIVVNGNSGGGTFDLSTGELLGINVAKSPDCEVGYMVPVDVLLEIVNRRMLIDEIVDSELIYSEVGVRLRRVNLRYGKYRRGMLVTAVEPGSAADEAGWKRGDVLIGLDGYQMINQDAVLYVLQDPRRRGPEVNYMIVRGDDMTKGVIGLPDATTIAGNIRDEILAVNMLSLQR